MPYLNLDDYDEFVHFQQLFFHAHPTWQAEHEAVRAQTGRADEYFLSLPIMQAMATWGRARHLITRAAAARLVEVAAELARDPADVVPLTPRVLGTPPRLQPSVLSTEIFQWCTLRVPNLAEDDEVAVFTVPAALTYLEALMAQEDFPAGHRERAQRLRAWLATQG